MHLLLWEAAMPIRLYTLLSKVIFDAFYSFEVYWASETARRLGAECSHSRSLSKVLLIAESLQISRNPAKHTGNRMYTLQNTAQVFNPLRRLMLCSYSVIKY